MHKITSIEITKKWKKKTKKLAVMDYIRPDIITVAI